jgi:hypothetical protein
LPSGGPANRDRKGAPGGDNYDWDDVTGTKRCARIGKCNWNDVTGTGRGPRIGKCDRSDVTGTGRL